MVEENIANNYKKIWIIWSENYSKIWENIQKHNNELSITLSSLAQYYGLSMNLSVIIVKLASL